MGSEDVDNAPDNNWPVLGYGEIMMTLIVAGNHQQFTAYVNSRKLTPRSVRFIDSRRKLLGLDPKENTVVHTGTFYDHPEIGSILREEEIRGFQAKYESL